MSNFLNRSKNLWPALAVAFVLLVVACTPKTADKTMASKNPMLPDEPVEWDTIGKPLTGEAPEEEPEDYVFMDEAVITPDVEERPDSLPRYNASHTFEHDLIHTKLALSFDWTKQRALGTATLTLRPWFYPTDRLTLDAKNFDIHGVRFEGGKDTLAYEYDNKQLTIWLGKTFTRNDTYTVVIDYTAKPEERDDFGGSMAITSDKGLYFINPDGSEPGKPKQIWTQGETESNSHWFPTVDKPNERCTQEMYLTVEDQYATLSNGTLVSSKKNADGTRTDYWKMDKPHAPYLFMMAIGEYAVVKDQWRGIPVNYYVEPEYEPYARDIFPYTTEMLEFFSNKLNYPYPFSKYSQVVVRDYVSGAMENTTGVIFGEFVQQDKRSLLDNHWMNEKVVAHEMFHHWFGDLVTTESWANVTLNEGFANYSEYLWLEHKYGRDEADFHEMTERQGYIYSALDGGHPLIHFGYENRESMFDAHSYNKGGAILHMLRKQIGDDAFFAGLNRYLTQNEYSDVEAHELRLAFEDVTGQDLNWFFNQWFFNAGHPNLEISYDWDQAAGQAFVTITQIQEPSDDVPYIFDLPLEVDIYDASGKARRESIRMTKRTQTFAFDTPARPALINVDAEKALLAVKDDQHTAEEWAFMYRHAPLFQDRSEAIDFLKNKSSDLAKQIMKEALKDKHRAIRRDALDKADMTDPDVLAAIVQMAKSDPDPGVRSTAIGVLVDTGDKQYIPVFEAGMQPDQPYSVWGASLNALSLLDPEAAVAAAKKVADDDNPGVVLAVAELYAANPTADVFTWFRQHAGKIDNMGAFKFYDLYTQYLTGLNDPALLEQVVDDCKAVALNTKTSLWRRFSNTKTIADLRNFYRGEANKEKVDALSAILTEIREKETDPTLKLYYGMFDQP